VQPAPRHWRVSDAEPLPGLHPVLAQVLAARGYDATAAASFLDTQGGYHDPFGLPAMAAAVATVQAAIREGTTIAIYGDYDADGVTACAMLTRCLRAAGATVIPYIPNRMTEGYGLHAAALAELAARGAGCVITVDCGTSSVEVALGRPLGMRLVVTDHHLALAPGGSPPQLAPADALVNPKLPGSTYAFDGLAGAGVAFKLVQALEATGVVPAGSADASLGLAALGTIADMMPLRGENRVIVRDGLPRIADLPGLRALCEAAGTSLPPRGTDIAFAVGPRINAAGRMEDARLALELCLCDDPEESARLAPDRGRHTGAVFRDVGAVVIRSDAAIEARIKAAGHAALAREEAVADAVERERSSLDHHGGVSNPGRGPSFGSAMASALNNSPMPCAPLSVRRAAASSISSALSREALALSAAARWSMPSRSSRSRCRMGP